MPLFEPSGRGITLTSYGEEFLPYVRSILQQTEAAKEHMKKKADKLNSEIHFAYTASVAYRCIPRLFREFLSQSERNYLIYSDEMPSDEIVKGLKEGCFDLGICSRTAPDPDIIQRPLLYQPLVLILPEHGEYSRTAFQSPEDVCTVPFVSYRSDYPMYRQVSALFDRFQLHPQISHYAYSEDAIAQLVAQELGVSIVAETESLAIYDNIRILRPDWLSDGRYLYLTYHRLRHQGDAVRSMMDFTDHFF